jgi:hypothetical protein
MLDKCYIVNTPMFFAGSFYEAEIKPYIDASTNEKVIITGENTHTKLKAQVESHKLP